ncbi:MAG: tRNA (adenosine(37)-N6)-threonylcarbamoyltransferase complex ATPase subunit type 1 TsaE [Candidatus Atribacteria bacterium]|nr:tRNA (adenosine(37)-N6)-threonylcarbamoyltransferase complex ATPase subunit type 1 TsaE [Candidatus Atribacteria bacterium]MCK4308945.1 tRNA (adenosine(37)-N6)-threonylcarbamoyltransferase complex ATPase subunit type 1 TsaE [Candidatus Atribacteria bacterium]
MDLTIITKSPEDTQKLGKEISKLIKPGDLLAFYGELGAGKTCLIQGISQGLEVKDYVVSPSFTIINEYKGKILVFHFDLFRLSNIEEILDLGYEEYFYGEGLTVIEWAEKIENLLPPDHLKIDIKFKSYYERTISLIPQGNRFRIFLKELAKIENFRD